MSKKAITSRTKNSKIKDEKANLNEMKLELQKLKIEYEKELQKYKESSKDIIEREEKFNNISKKINKIKYKQLSLSNSLDNAYINNLNNYKIDQSTKIIFLTILGFPFPNQELFYFDSPDNLIAQLSLSKDFLFNLLLTNKEEYDIYKSNFDKLNKDINILKPIYDYMKLNFEIVNLMQKREIIFDENKNYIKIKNNSLINVKALKKKIKDIFSSMKKILKPNKKNKDIKTENLTQKTKDFDDLSSSNLLSIKDFDEISGKSFILSLSNENSILDLFNEEEINKFENGTKIINHKYYNNNSKTVNQTEGNIPNDENKINKIMNNINNKKEVKRLSRSPDANSILLMEKQKNKDKTYNRSELMEKFRSPQHKISKGKDTLQIETPVGDSGCCASCT